MNIVATVLTLISFSSLALDSSSTLESPKEDFAKTSEAIHETMQKHLFNPSQLRTDEYRLMQDGLSQIIESKPSREELIARFNELWANGPFSHVQLSNAEMSVENLAHYLDNLRVGGGGAHLSWRGNIAILTVTTMMGQDTIEQIDAAFQILEEKGAESLIVDLRNNAGGAFAVRPLVEHLITEPIEAGGFVSQQWHTEFNRPPTLADFLQHPPWKGWSIRKFWEAAQEDLVVRVQFSPAGPVYAGPVYILTSGKTASAAELAVDALKATGRAIVIGENTAGTMLSQKPYDVFGGFHLSLPVADYYSASAGRIEGVGILPDIRITEERAIELAIQEIVVGHQNFENTPTTTTR